MNPHEKTLKIIKTVKAILAAHDPMAVRQVYYQLVSQQVVENNRNRYQAVSGAIVKARQQGIISGGEQ